MPGVLKYCTLHTKFTLELTDKGAYKHNIITLLLAVWSICFVSHLPKNSIWRQNICYAGGSKITAVGFQCQQTTDTTGAIMIHSCMGCS